MPRVTLVTIEAIDTYLSFYCHLDQIWNIIFQIADDTVLLSGLNLNRYVPTWLTKQVQLHLPELGLLGFARKYFCWPFRRQQVRRYGIATAPDWLGPLHTETNPKCLQSVN